MFVIINSFRQVLRTPVKLILFLLLLALSTAFLTIGANLWIVSGRNLQAFEDSFITIGTVQQKPNVLDAVPLWDAWSKTYSYVNRPVYDAEIPLSALDFKNAGYIHTPEKRPYYGAYHESYVINEYPTSRAQWLILEAVPLEDCVPSEPVKLQVKRVLYGDLEAYTDEIWFCDHLNDDPAPMYADKTYVMSVQRYPISVRADYDGDIEEEYIPAAGIESGQYDKNGALLPDMFGQHREGWEEVTEGYYDTLRGQRWQELIKGLDKFLQTIPVVPTNATHLLMDFYNGNANIIDGRDISGEEYANGSKVCLIQNRFANNNGLKVGDILPLPLYYANYKNAASDDFAPNGGGGFNFAILNLQGKSYSVFEDGEYTIVGIYETTGGSYLTSGFESGNNMVVIPATSVENSDENNIIAYAPMKAYNTSFEIPNGPIGKFTTEWNRQGIEGLEIQFYDKGYTQLKDGFDRMHAISMILIVVGTVVMILVLAFFTFLFIVKNKKRTAVERSLGFWRGKCALSLLSGMLLLSVFGIAAGGIAGYLLGSSVIERSMVIGSEETFNLLYSNWVNSADKLADIQMHLHPADLNVFIALSFSVLAVSVFIASIGVWRNLKYEPLMLLSAREDE